MPESQPYCNDRPIVITVELLRALGPHLLASGVTAEPDALARALGCLPVSPPVIVPRPLPAGFAGSGGADGQT